MGTRGGETQDTEIHSLTTWGDNNKTVKNIMHYKQLSKPEVTAARNQNSIGDRMEKKP